jgi:hypothetical protein
MRLRLVVLGVAVMLVSAACGPVDWLMFRFGPDTTSEPNGTYTLESVAYDPARNHAESTVINITVQN